MFLSQRTRASSQFPLSFSIFLLEECAKYCSLEGKSIEVVVGSDPLTTFSIHEGLIRGSSDFFDKAMGGTWKEAADRVINLPDDDPDVFRIYLHWLYRGSIPCGWLKPETVSDVHYIHFAKAYVLGDKLQDEDFCDADIDAIIQMASVRGKDGRNFFPGRDAVRHLYDNTLPSSRGRRFLVALYLHHAEKDWFGDDKDRKVFGIEFLCDLAVAFLDKTAYPDPLEVSAATDPCEYHHHDPSSPCDRKKAGA